MFRLLAIDLDGTLLTPSPHKLITPRTHQLLCRVAGVGVALVIATGQSSQVLRAVCAELPLTAPQIIENGALIVDIRSGLVLHEKLMPEELILPVLDMLRALGFYRAYHTYECVYADNNAPRVRDWYRPPVPPVVEVEDVASLYPQTCIKVVGIGEESTLPGKRRELEGTFAGKLYVTQSSFDLVEFLHPHVSKGNALKAIAADLGIAPQEVVAIGDNHNDIGMIRFAGLGVAMGNASEEVKAAADYVTLSNSEEGVAEVIEKFILPGIS